MSAQAQRHYTHSVPQFKHFNKYDFVKSFIATVSDPKVKEEEEKRAVIIADAIEETQVVLFEHLVTKQDLEHGLKALELKLTIRLTVIMATLLTLMPLTTEFLRRLF